MDGWMARFFSHSLSCHSCSRYRVTSVKSVCICFLKQTQAHPTSVDMNFHEYKMGIFASFPLSVNGNV